MFIVDGKELSLVPDERTGKLSPAAKFVDGLIKTIRAKDNFFPRRYEWHPKLVRAGKDNPGRFIQPTDRPVRCTQVWVDESGMEHTFVYTDPIRRGMKKINFLGNIAFSENEIEKVILFEYLSKSFNVDYVVYDPEETARKHNADRKRIRDIENQIMEDMPENELRMIAASYEIYNADTADIELVRKDLFDMISTLFKSNPEETGQLWKARSVLDDNTKLRATIQKLIDNKIVVIKPGGKRAWWINEGKKGETKYSAQPIVSIVGDKVDSLVNYLSKPESKDDLEYLTKKIK
jgi:hypothetical protein